MVSDVRYGFLGDVDDLPSFDPVLVYIIPQPVSVPRDGIWRMSFNLIAMDKLMPDKENFEDIISDCMGILMDIYSALLYNDGSAVESWSVQTGTQIVPFQERFTEYMAGGTMTINIDIFQDNCRADLPFN